MMQRQALGDTDLQVSRLCYGMMAFGTQVVGRKATALYNTFRQSGGNFFDTAHCYCFWVENGLGVSERVLGQLVRDAGDRDDVIIASKGGHPAAGDAYPRPDAYISPATLAADIDDSLARLGMDRIDVYYLHRDDLRVPAGEIIEMLNEEVAKGRIRHLGASNWSTGRIQEANARAGGLGIEPFSVSQPQWSLAEQNPGSVGDPTLRFLSPEDKAWHARAMVPVAPYSPTARGYFATNGQVAATAFDNGTSRSRLSRVRKLADVHGCSPNQIALAYLLNQPFPVFPIIGTTKMDHLNDAIGAAGITLSEQQLNWLDLTSSSAG